MRNTFALLTLMTLLIGCGSTQRGSSTQGSPCSQDADCVAGLVCDGCSGQAFTCITGCRSDSECASGQHCQQHQCLTCPCPSQCG